MGEEDLKRAEEEFESAFAEFSGDGDDGVSEDQSVQEQNRGNDAQQNQDMTQPDTAPESNADSGIEQRQQPDEDIEKIKARMKSWEGRLSASDKRANELAAENEGLKQKLAEIEATRQSREMESGRSDAAQQKRADDVYQGLVDSYGEDFARDVVSIAEKKVQEALRPLQETQRRQEEAYQQNAAKAFFDDVGKEHPDFKELVLSGDVLAWINEQPEYIAVGMRQVYQGGQMATVKNTNNLLADYKRARNLNQGKSPTTHQQSVRQSAQAAAAIPSRRSSSPPQSTPSDEDFDGWFNLHAQKLESDARRG